MSKIFGNNAGSLVCDEATAGIPSGSFRSRFDLRPLILFVSIVVNALVIALYIFLFLIVLAADDFFES